jgi:hypothetical protein
MLGARLVGWFATKTSIEETFLASSALAGIAALAMGWMFYKYQRLPTQKEPLLKP